VYVSPVTNATYVLNTSRLDWRAAQRSCNNNVGGHLVSFNSTEEQVGSPAAAVALQQQPGV
jgi:hypothetical protein